jgi:hypothetical protein
MELLAPNVESMYGILTISFFYVIFMVTVGLYVTKHEVRLNRFFWITLIVLAPIFGIIIFVLATRRQTILNRD